MKFGFLHKSGTNNTSTHVDFALYRPYECKTATSINEAHKVQKLKGSDLKDMMVFFYNEGNF